MILTASNSGSHVSAGETGNPKLGGDHEMVPVYAAMLLLMFCQTFQSSMVASVK